MITMISIMILILIVSYLLKKRDKKVLSINIVAKEKREDFSSLFNINLSSYLLIYRDKFSKQIFFLNSMNKIPFQLKEEKIERYFENSNIERHLTRRVDEISLFNDPKFVSNLLILKFLDNIYLCLTFKDEEMVISYLNNMKFRILEYLILNLNDIQKRVAIKKSQLDLHSGLKNKSELLSNAFEATFLGLLDLNNFKKLNDSEGHLEGDRAISYLSKLLRKFFSDSELFRYGGDEFVILFSCSLEEAFRRIGLMNILIKEKFKYISISIGFTDFLAVEKSLEVADKALYAAKRKSNLSEFFPIS